ncbi:HET-like protein [Mycena venus]|uniref:HET-like protein n=1 Tax=Mycena venus TaxID=2733690 RepID=A0A8H6XGZ8_9AGAR|nr:HET-like protein [Mycena venus]
MSGEGNEVKTINYNISGMYGVLLGLQHHHILSQGATAAQVDQVTEMVAWVAAGGTGEGPTVNIDNSTNKIVNQGHGLEEVLCKWLESPPDTKDRQYELQSLHHEATGRWLLCDDRFVRWKDTPSSLWIRGISGTGKSVLSSTVIEEITLTCPEQSAVAYFYFDFRNERQRMDIMIRSIVWQLSRQSPSPYRTLHQLYEMLKNGAIQPQHVHLLGVLKDLLSEFDKTYIIIDGLDECRKTDSEPLVQFIHGLCYPTKNVVHLLFTSQPLEEFQRAFKAVTFIELDSVVSNDDISSFVSSKVPGMGNWASHEKHVKDVTKQIVQKSNGMFRLAACLLIELGHCYWKDDWEESLTALPADLFGIYSRFLIRATGSLKTVFLEAIFRWLVFSARQVTMDELADALAFCLDDPMFDLSDPAKSIYHPDRRQGNSDSFRLLEGLIVIKNNDWDKRSTNGWDKRSTNDWDKQSTNDWDKRSTNDWDKRSTNDWDKRSTNDWFEQLINDRDKPSITLAHSSVKDYILSLQFHQEFSSIIHLTKGVSHRFITQTCVRYLLLFADPKHIMTKGTLPNYPISLYAAEYWFHHLQLCDEHDQEALLPSTMCLLEDGSTQYAAMYQLCDFNPYWTQGWDRPIPPAVCACAKMGYTEGVRFLLIEHKASLDQVTQDGRTALHLAVEEGHLDIARLLVKHSTFVDQANKDGKTALHLASEEGQLDIVKLLIEHNTSVDLADKDGKSALYLALEKGHLNIARLLIMHNANVDLATEDGWTALHLASAQGCIDTAWLLIEHSASLDQVTQDGRTMLHLAVEEGHLDIARLLVKHSTFVDQANKDGKTALHLVSEEGQLDIVKLLIEYNTSIDLADKDGKSALYLALEKGHLNTARLLIMHNANVDLATEDGWTALHLASAQGCIDTTWLLIEHSASLDQVTQDGRTMLHLAVEEGHLDIARLLVKHSTFVDQANKDGKTALHLASEEGQLDIVKLLIEHNTSVDLTDKDGKSALYLALEKGHLNIARLLIMHNASVDLATGDGWTALHLASARGHINTAWLLIEHNASVNLATKDGKDALDLALEWGHFDIVRLLIEHNPSVELAAKDGSPIHSVHLLATS